MTEDVRPILHAAHGLPSALAAFDRLKAAIGGRRPAVFLDFDGTLTPIMPRPDLAVLSGRARAAVARLSDRCPVAIVSGRDRMVVERMVGLPSVIYAGSHGFDIELPDGRVLDHGGGIDFQPVLERVNAALHAGLAPIPGTLIERKHMTVAVHFRNVPVDREPEVEAVVGAIVATEPHLKVTEGKKVFELQPNLDWDKGKAVLWLLEVLGLEGRSVVPMFFGDDVTDEHAFAVVQGRGIGVIAMPASETGRVTAADFRVEGPDEVIAVIERLAAG